MRLIVILILAAFWSEPILAQRVEYTLNMRMDGRHELFTGDSTHIWGFIEIGGFGSEEKLLLPSPTLTATVGDSVIVKVVNVSDEGHTIHWHGLDVDQENDGVPHTSDFVLTGDTFTYRFKATHAGNFIYHCHVTTTLHLMMGMYGSFIVYSNQPDEIYPGGPRFDRQYDFLGSELDKALNDDFMTGGMPYSDEKRHFLLNGLQKQQLYEASKNRIELHKGERVLLRLINIGFDVNDYHFPEAVQAIVYTSDGRPLPEPFETVNLQLYPGERYSVIIETDEDDFKGNIVVNYLKMYRLQYAETNHIGINNDVYPVYIGEQADSRNTGLHIFPNPAINRITVQGLSQDVRSVQVFDTKGAQYLLPINKAGEVDVSRLKSGFYLMRASGSSSLSGKFIKR